MSTTVRREALRRTLRRSLGVILPSDAETLLLRCLLYTGDEGRRAWLEWCAATGDPMKAFKDERLGQKSLLPLLHVAVDRNSLAVAAPVAGWLRAAFFREQLRGNAYRRILDETVTALCAAGTMPVVLKGCAFSDTVYPDPGTRHSHGIELLVRDDHLEKIIAGMPHLGFSAVRHNKARRPGSAMLSWKHSAGLPLEIRTRLFDIPRYAGGIEAVWQRARPLPGHAALQLCLEDALLHVCGNAAMSGSRISLRWVCDAHFLLQHHSALDWSLFTRNVEVARLALPLSGILRYLAEELHRPIPAGVIERLDALAEATDDTGYEVAAMGALVASHSRMRRLIVAGPDWQSRYLLARRLLAPSPQCIREMGWIAGKQWLAAYYMRRPLEYFGLRIARLAARRPRAVLSRPPASQ